MYDNCACVRDLASYMWNKSRNSPKKLSLLLSMYVHTYAFPITYNVCSHIRVSVRIWIPKQRIRKATRKSVFQIQAFTHSMTEYVYICNYLKCLHTHGCECMYALALYAYDCVYMHALTWLCVYACPHKIVHICMPSQDCVYIHALTRLCIYACPHKIVYIYMPSHDCAYMHALTWLCIYACPHSVYVRKVWTDPKHFPYYLHCVLTHMIVIYTCPHMIVHICMPSQCIREKVLNRFEALPLLPTLCTHTHDCACMYAPSQQMREKGLNGSEALPLLVVKALCRTHDTGAHVYLIIVFVAHHTGGQSSLLQAWHWCTCLPGNCLGSTSHWWSKLSVAGMTLVRMSTW